MYDQSFAHAFVHHQYQGMAFPSEDTHGVGRGVYQDQIGGTVLLIELGGKGTRRHNFCAFF
jgi:hypothetical protein